ncbi:MAG TPA: hypothetical protein PLT36_06180 [Erysipelotrichaceae bacterium]|jgi:hypothetical protein|nr:hypothetical protein [Erysipelotrichia bacterium]HPX33074.1 hypothetical protein [Erysipelotrichaceae bacterium]HQA84354.1 hypothetical protein [Erysipelotrichaceae bacterium]
MKKRNLEFKYCIGTTSDEGDLVRISIKDVNESGWERNLFDCTSDEQFEGPIEFLKRIRDQEKWTINSLGQLRYSFEEDKNNIIFQFDDLFGFVLQVNKEKFNDEVLNFINKYTV